MTVSKQLLTVVAICSLAWPAALFSQQTQPTSPDRGRIIGTVVTTTTEPLMAADVTVRNAADSTVASIATALDGRFLVDGLSFGKYTLRISFLGYKTQNIRGIEVSAASPLVDLGLVKLQAALVAERAAEPPRSRAQR
jgi:methyl coenzyme M reductase beta subunit